MKEIKEIKAQRDKAADELYKLQLQYINLQRELKANPNEKHQEQLSALHAQIEKRSLDKKSITNTTNQVIERLYLKQQPEQLIEEWQDDIPINLFPVRLETKYRKTLRGTQLLVRIYPDDISITTHEKMLTESELTFGRKHWEILFKNSNDKELTNNAWKNLWSRFGSNRATWVAKSTKPTNWNQRADLSLPEALIFADAETKPDSWTKAPHTNVLPDRFVLMGYRAGKEMLHLVGNQIKDIVVVGPAPIIDENDPSFTRDDLENRIQYGEDFAWMADFEIAVAQGLGFMITQSDEDVKLGYDQLLVVGLKSSADEKDGKELFEALIDNHKYSEEGFALLKQGTPTNNTDNEDSGYQRQESLEDFILLAEQDHILFTPSDNFKEATDGQRLAEYFGVDYEVFQSVNNGNLTDHSEAIAMNTALHPGTLGYFVTSMLNGVLDEPDKELLRNHFINYVSGRGPLASIRVGNQPYGIIVTSDFNSWSYPSKRIEYSLSNLPDSSKVFYQKMYQILTYMAAKWKDKTDNLPHISKNGDAGATLLKILGLHPSSVELFQRKGYSYDYLENLEKFSINGKYFADTMMMAIHASSLNTLLKSWGYKTQKENGAKKTPPMLLEIIFQHYNTRLDKYNLVDAQPLSEEQKIKPYQDDIDLNYIDWLLANIDNETSLEKQDFGDKDKPSSLLLMMLKNGLLLETNHSIFKFLATKNINASELLQSRKFMNMSTSASVSPWEIYKAPVNKLINTEQSGATLFNHVHKALLDINITRNLKENKWALEILKDLPTARLQRAFIEHVDTLSYRLDSWQTALFDQRIVSHRNTASSIKERKTGLYLGSYGYLENVKMRNTRKKISENALPAGLIEGEDNLYLENENGGYVHAPSLNHATAAAILRNGYLTHANRDEADLLSVNLSSERVRRAKAILEGIRNGQTLEALLGYQFERGLHDWSTKKVNPVILNQLKPDFRKAFPIKKTKIPQEGNTSGPEETIVNYEVINGLDLANVILPFPFGVANLPALNAEQIKALEFEKNNLQNTLDALKDLMTAESAYQMATGNFERAAAVMQSVSIGNIPPEVEVINTARSTQMTFTNRIVLTLDATLSTNPWSNVQSSAKSITEPALNHWIGELLGNPADIRCLVTAKDSADNVINVAVSLEDLNLQPLDFVLLIRNKLETSGASELESRIRYSFLKSQSLPDNTLVTILFSDSGSPNDLSKKSFAEILPFANYIRQLIGNGRPLNAIDFVSTTVTETQPNDNPTKIDLTELKNRTAALYQNYLEAAIQTLQNTLSAIQISLTDTTLENLRETLKATADVHFNFAFPNMVFDKSADAAKLLIEQAKTVLLRLTEVQQSYLAQNAKLNPTGEAEQESKKLIKMIQIILGDNSMVIPKFSFSNKAEIVAANASSDELLTYAKSAVNPPAGESAGLGMNLPVAEFLHSASLVREKMHTLEMVTLLHNNFNQNDLNGKPLQLPYKENDSWLSVEFPKNTELLSDTIAYVHYAPQGFNPNNAQSGLLFDEWTETIPNREEVSGITFNYNQPNSSPPQAILLAVSPNETGKWNWNDLTNTILNTFQRAKERAIEPDDVDTMPNLTTLLPATMAEFSASRFTNISLDYSLNLSEKFLNVKNLETKIKLP
ncbi:hypothetical protein [Pedobacter jejuensis]|uniref:Uncharacterized protein n=1 Tax=Pedobacter jejuensis TaxID=1268550 RepID=A0A3N0BVL6_9SPHI|nr:hypothetical protein [Pedobacter jejuensis]RNL53458.1 hypothetical protein D7004_10280 [Pedobacter jejuensis]